MIESDLQHDRMIRVDPLKMQHVMPNVAENAVQAMHGTVRIWVRTSTIGSPLKPRIAILLGNAGSHIAAEDLPRLFDAFFMKNKRGGTGLGLAIVK